MVGVFSKNIFVHNEPDNPGLNQIPVDFRPLYFRCASIDTMTTTFRPNSSYFSQLSACSKLFTLAAASVTCFDKKFPSPSAHIQSYFVSIWDHTAVLSKHFAKTSLPPSMIITQKQLNILSFHNSADKHRISRHRIILSPDDGFHDKLDFNSCCFHPPAPTLLSMPVAISDVAILRARFYFLRKQSAETRNGSRGVK